MPSPNSPHDPNCIFCKIVAGQIPCYKLYEDADVLSFLDIGPIAKGHSLVIPKGHWVTMDQVPDEIAASCMSVVPCLSRAIMQATNGKAYNVLQNNGKLAHQAVDHVHIHIIPKTDTTGLGIDWPASSLDDAKAQSLIESITAAI